VAAQQFLERIESPQLTDVEIDWGGLAVHSVYPRRLPDLFAGQPLLVQGRYDLPGEGVVTVRGRIAGRAWEERVQVAFASIGDAGGHDALASTWARAAVHDLMNGLYLRDDPDREDAITDLGLTFGLVTRFTSFVAVEDRFWSSLGGLGRLGMGFGADGSGLGAMGLGSLGTIGRGGGSGYGSGYGRGAGAGILPGRIASALSIRAGTVEIRGSLSKMVIRRAIRMHTNELRAAYERQLMLRPDLAGRVVVRFMITDDGTVTAVSIAESDIDSPEVDQGVADVFRRMVFPSLPDGGTTIVTYPIVFRPSDDDDDDGDRVELEVE
jgi:Ca-activated chloride channel family protein